MAVEFNDFVLLWNVMACICFCFVSVLFQGSDVKDTSRGCEPQHVREWSCRDRGEVDRRGLRLVLQRSSMSIVLFVYDAFDNIMNVFNSQAHSLYLHQNMNTVGNNSSVTLSHVIALSET